jgi:U4/U6 small nuclear ribonucleoprotein PRP31
MVVTVTATTTNGRQLTDDEWQRTEEACDMALALEEARKKIINYVASRMTIIAPNLSHVVGSATAAQLLSAAGGLKEFCKIPGCNVQALGNNRKIALGFSVVTSNPHGGGFIAQSPLVLSMPQDLRRKATKIIAGKATLAGRIDQSRASTDGKQ